MFGTSAHSAVSEGSRKVLEIPQEWPWQTHLWEKLAGSSKSKPTSACSGPCGAPNISANMSERLSAQLACRVPPAGESSTESYFLALMEAGSPRSRCPQSWLLVRPYLLAGRRPCCCVLKWPFLWTRVLLVSPPLPIRRQSYWVRAPGSLI